MQSHRQSARGPCDLPIPRGGWRFPIATAGPRCHADFMAVDEFDPQILVPRDLDVSNATRPPIGRILLVDDDPVVRELTGSVLRRAGHVVVSAERAPVALRELELDPLGFDLLITDLVMPGMTGLELSRRVHLTRPTMPVLFISGYSDELLDHAADIEPFMAEPYSADGLLDVVGSLLRKSVVA